MKINRERLAASRCPRCQTNVVRGYGLCSECSRKLLLPEACRRRLKPFRDDQEASPWQENAIRILEDQE